VIFTIDKIRFSDTFEFLLELKNSKLIKDFSITQSSLEKVFLKFARMQTTNVNIN